MAAKIDSYEPEDLDMTWETKDDRVPAPRPEPRPRVAPSARLSVAHWRIILAVALGVLLLTIGWCSGSAAGRSYVQRADLAIAEYEVRAAAAEDAAAFWESEATSATAAFEAVESDVASLTESLEQWQLYAKEASETIATLKQQKATPKPSTPKPVQTSYDTAGVEQWRSLVDEYFADDCVDAALSVMRQESGGNPGNTNASSGAAGLFQQMPKYWPARLAAAEAVFGDLPDDIYDPRANIAVSAYLSNGGRDWSHWSVKP